MCYGIGNIALDGLITMHKKTFGSQDEWVDDIPLMLMLCTDRTIAMMVDVAPQFQDNEKATRMLAPDDISAAIFVPETTKIQGMQVDGYYLINSRTTLLRLEPAIIMILTNENHACADGRSAGQIICAMMASMLAHEIRHEAQYFGKVQLRTIEKIRATDPEFAQDLENDWNARLDTGGYSHMNERMLSYEQDALIVEALTEMDWGHNGKTDDEMINDAVQLILS